ncbi:MAG: archaetidylserine decarboxylase [Halothiobacillaceae bacterium]
MNQENDNPESVRRDGFWRLAGVSLQYLLPHHLISRLIFTMARWRIPLVPWMIRRFVATFKVNLDEAEHADPAAYPSFNEFFTRALQPGVRPMPVFDPQDPVLLSPVDGRISQMGEIGHGRILQAKGRHYSLIELLGGDLDVAEPFLHGRFATIYLSPRDYHRVHMPCGGRLTRMIHVPGRLFSVSELTVRSVNRIFTRNERVVTLWDTPQGPVAMVLVGAINVGAIETVWSGLVTPPRGRTVSEWTYGGETGIEVNLQAGQEMGRFHLGSTVILLVPPGFEWRPEWQAGYPVRLHQPLAGPVVEPQVSGTEEDPVAESPAEPETEDDGARGE